MPIVPREWRWVVTDLDTVQLTFLDRLASDRSVEYVLNDAATAEGRVPSDWPGVNRNADDGDPYLAHNNRLLFGFRREVDGVPGFVCRFGGIVHQVEDEASSGNPTTHYTAYDPWQLLRSRPIRFGSDKNYRMPINGLSYSDVRADLIIKSLLANTHVEDGTTHIDYGQFGEFSTGTIEATKTVKVHFEQGTSVGDAWTKVVGLGGVGEEGIDIILSPVYDPINRPGICAALNVYKEAGESKPSAVFAWDQMPRSLVGISRLRDGTQMANKVVYFPQQGDGGGAIQGDATSVAKYGRYWLERFVQGTINAAVASAFAQVDLARIKDGKETVTIDPAPERSPDPFNEYFLGDRVQLYASSRLRDPLFVEKRVYGIPISISNSGTETIDKLLVTSPDE